MKPDSPLTQEEIALVAAAKLETGTDGFGAALRAAQAPGELDDVLHDALLASLLQPETAEHARAEFDAEFAEGLRFAAAAPATFDESMHDALIEKALQTAAVAAAQQARRGAPDNVVLLTERIAARKATAEPHELVPQSQRNPRVNRLRALSFVAFSMAAAVAVFFALPKAPAPKPYAAPSLIAVHTTTELFDQPFETSSTESRIDRIALVRASDLRENRYRSWGLR